MGDGTEKGTCSTNTVCNSGNCVPCVKKSTAVDGGCDELNPVCLGAASVGDEGTKCVCKDSPETICDIATSSVCTNNECMCGTNSDTPGNYNMSLKSIL